MQITCCCLFMEDSREWPDIPDLHSRCSSQRFRSNSNSLTTERNNSELRALWMKRILIRVQQCKWPILWKIADGNHTWASVCQSIRVNLKQSIPVLHLILAPYSLNSRTGNSLPDARRNWGRREGMVQCRKWESISKNINGSSQIILGRNPLVVYSNA